MTRSHASRLTCVAACCLVVLASVSPSVAASPSLRGAADTNMPLPVCPADRIVLIESYMNITSMLSGNPTACPRGPFPIASEVYAFVHNDSPSAGSVTGTNLTLAWTGAYGNTSVAFAASATTTTTVIPARDVRVVPILLCWEPAGFAQVTDYAVKVLHANNTGVVPFYLQVEVSGVIQGTGGVACRLPPGFKVPGSFELLQVGG